MYIRGHVAHLLPRRELSRASHRPRGAHGFTKDSLVNGLKLSDRIWKILADRGRLALSATREKRSFFSCGAGGRLGLSQAPGHVCCALVACLHPELSRASHRPRGAHGFGANIVHFSGKSAYFDRKLSDRIWKILAEKGESEAGESEALFLRSGGAYRHGQTCVLECLLRATENLLFPIALCSPL